MNDISHSNRQKTADTVINIIAILGIIPAFIMLVLFVAPNVDYRLADILDPEIGSLVFALLFMFGAGLCVYLSNPHKLIFLLPLLCIAVIPAMAPPAPQPEVEWRPLELSNGGRNYARSFASAAVACKKNKHVQLSGLVYFRLGSSVATLPEGCRPKQKIILIAPTQGNMATRVDILPNGQIIPSNTKGEWISLNPISFYIDQDQASTNSEDAP